MATYHLLPESIKQQVLLYLERHDFVTAKEIHDAYLAQIAKQDHFHSNTINHNSSKNP